MEGRRSKPTSYPGRFPDTSGLLEPEWPRLGCMGASVDGSTALPRAAEDSRLCIGVDWAVRVPRLSDGDARLWCDADFRSSGMRGSVVWPRPALAGFEATGMVKPSFGSQGVGGILTYL